MTLRCDYSWWPTLGAPMQDGLGRVLDHPFLVGLANGDLPREAFGYFIIQDTLYLGDYARALALLAAKAPAPDAGTLAAHAGEAVAAELELHPKLLVDAGVDPELLQQTPASPATTAYTSYLLAVAAQRPFHEGLAAALPCYWIYQQVGAALQAQGSVDPVYQQWIDAYAAADFADTVAQVLDIVDRTVATLTSEQITAMAGHIETTTRYEWMFWDAAVRGERWPW
ncbi:thiaminase II [Flexivirga meconopsidis]|uniref:thiaminase II n=1 Tax=Flexivirga meconopsidis TaxID=2977121 RepID=UPI00223EC4C6|nr:thiaminase II [Flexivirga meconopsidis]